MRASSSAGSRSAAGWGGMRRRCWGHRLHSASIRPAGGTGVRSPCRLRPTRAQKPPHADEEGLEARDSTRPTPSAGRRRDPAGVRASVRLCQAINSYGYGELAQRHRRPKAVHGLTLLPGVARGRRWPTMAPTPGLGRVPDHQTRHAAQTGTPTVTRWTARPFCCGPVHQSPRDHGPTRARSATRVQMVSTGATCWSSTPPPTSTTGLSTNARVDVMDSEARGDAVGERVLAVPVDVGGAARRGVRMAVVLAVNCQLARWRTGSRAGWHWPPWGQLFGSRGSWPGTSAGLSGVFPVADPTPGSSGADRGQPGGLRR